MPLTSPIHPPHLTLPIHPLPPTPPIYLLSPSPDPSPPQTGQLGNYSAEGNWQGPHNEIPDALRTGSGRTNCLARGVGSGSGGEHWEWGRSGGEQWDWERSEWVLNEGGGKCMEVVGWRGGREAGSWDKTEGF